MGLRDQFVQRLMPYLGQSYPISARDAFSQSLEIAEWVSRWIASQRLPTRTLEETVAAPLAFKDAIGASTSIGRASDSVGEDIVEAHIHRCPIAGLSRAHPNLCYVTCGVIGTVTSHHQGPLWVSLEHTLAWDDHPCHIIVARTEHPPQGKCRARFPVDSDAAEALVSETEPIAPVVRYPEKVLMSFKEHPELLRLCHELLEPLRREDRLHGSQLVTTLETYLKFKMSAKKTSQALFIHPGTLKYRLHKIQVLTGWDLHSPYALFEVLTCMFLSTDVQEPFKGTGW